jgi:Ni/Co efflux regulator RcnB
MQVPHRPGYDQHGQRYDPRVMGNREARDCGARGWHQGGRIPSEYRNRQYYVNDWHGHGLRQPPRGHQWVQMGGDYVLIAIASGVIAQLLINH